jgi:hypothetical protein
LKAARIKRAAFLIRILIKIIMEGKEIIRGVVDALTGKMTYQFTVPLRVIEPVIQPEPIIPPKQSLWDRMKGIPKPEIVYPELIEPEKERSFTIYQSVVINQYRIAGKALSFPNDLFEEEEKMLAYVPQHLPTMCYIIAAAVQNNYKEPDPELIKFFEYNLDNVDILQILVASLQAANMQAFLTSIVLMNGMAKILEPKASPQDGSE